MNKFFNNLKRKFTAPKTRHMQKKIKSMEDYLGIAEAEFKKMQEEAEFYKGKQKAISKARRKLKSGNTLFKGYDSPSVFLKEVKNYNCTTLKDSSKFKKEVTDLPTKDITDDLTDDCLAMYQTFCQTCKQEIKDIFEQKKTQFSIEKTKLMELSKLIKEFDNESDQTKKLENWNAVRSWYKQIQPNLIGENTNPVAQIYNKTLEQKQEIICESIKKSVNSLFDKATNAIDTAKDEQTKISNQMEFTSTMQTYKNICEDFDEKTKKPIIAMIETKDKEIHSKCF